MHESGGDEEEVEEKREKMGFRVGEGSRWERELGTGKKREKKVINSGVESLSRSSCSNSLEPAQRQGFDSNSSLFSQSSFPYSFAKFPANGAFKPLPQYVPYSFQGLCPRPYPCLHNYPSDAY